MAIIKNEIPILEFDTEQTAVLNPTHENLGLNLPKKCVANMSVKRRNVRQKKKGYLRQSDRLSQK